MPSADPHVSDRIHDRGRRLGSVACVGLDPRPTLLPPDLVRSALARHGDTPQAVADAFLAFNCGLIDACAGACVAVKPQAACYEAYGAPGLAALAATVAYARAQGVPVILDGKRNDIGSTAEHYAQAYLGRAPGLGGTPLPGLQADWLTINAYLGSDGVTPFVAATPGQHGVFILVKTSNPSSGEFQGLPSGSGTVMEAMARLVHGWGMARLGRSGLSDVGAVVGATYPEEARQLRRLMPHALFLVPGYGAQGAGPASAVAGRNAEGGGILVTSSRAIIGAWQQHPDGAGQWAAAARGALDAMNAALAAV